MKRYKLIIHKIDPSKEDPIELKNINKRLKMKTYSEVSEFDDKEDALKAFNRELTWFKGMKIIDKYLIREISLIEDDIRVLARRSADPFELQIGKLD